MSIKKTIFREYDIRGIYPSEINEESAYDIGRASGTHLIRNGLKNIVVGRDNRISSDSLCSAFIKGILKTGCNVTFTGITSTPAISFFLCTMNFEGGINITASHNPVDHNGVKVYEKDGYPVAGEGLQELLHLITKQDFEIGNGEYKEENLNPSYTSYIKQKLVIPSNVKVLVASGNGCTGPLVSEIFSKLGQRFIPLDCKLDSAFPHGISNPEDPVYMSYVSKKVLELEADIGFVLDADGDRLGVIDKFGTHYSSDKVLILLAYGLSKNIKDLDVVADIKSSKIVSDVISSYGGHVRLIKTGRTNVLKYTLGRQVIGGEFSGHLYIGPGYYGFDDGIFAACTILQILETLNINVTDFMNNLPRRESSAEIKVPCSDESKFLVIENIQKEALKDKELKNVLTIDGIRADISDTGWFLVRASNTTPVLTVRYEGIDSDELEKCRNKVAGLLATQNLAF